MKTKVSESIETHFEQRTSSWQSVARSLSLELDDRSLRASSIVAIVISRLIVRKRKVAKPSSWRKPLEREAALAQEVDSSKARISIGILSVVIGGACVVAQHTHTQTHTSGRHTTASFATRSARAQRAVVAAGFWRSSSGPIELDAGDNIVT